MEDKNQLNKIWYITIFLMVLIIIFSYSFFGFITKNYLTLICFTYICVGVYGELIILIIRGRL